MSVCFVHKKSEKPVWLGAVALLSVLFTYQKGEKIAALLRHVNAKTKCRDRGKRYSTYRAALAARRAMCADEIL